MLDPRVRYRSKDEMWNDKNFKFHQDRPQTEYRVTPQSLTSFSALPPGNGIDNQVANLQLWYSNIQK